MQTDKWVKCGGSCEVEVKLSWCGKCLTCQKPCCKVCLKGVECSKCGQQEVA